MRRRSATRAVAESAILLWLAGRGLHAAEPVFSALLGGDGQDYATSVTSDAQGNTYVAGLTYSADFPVTAGAFQTTFGGTSDAFIAKLGPTGNLLWCTYLGGVLDGWATGVAVDASGNVLVTGQTRSPNFPLASPIERVYNNGVTDDYDAFVAKLDPTGATLLYSTFLGGNADDGAAGIAVDSAGDATVAVTTNSTVGFPGIQNPAANQYGIVVSKLDPAGALLYSFFHSEGSAAAIVLDASGNSYISGAVNSQALAFKLSADGTHKLYETTFGGSSQALAAAIAVDSTGAAWVAGSTSSADFPLVNPLQTSPGARPMWSSSNSGATWTPLDNLPFAQPKLLVPDPNTPTTLYEASGDLGIFKSLDAGMTWSPASSGIGSKNVQALAIDPVHTQTLYAATVPTANNNASAVYKSTDGGGSWTLADTAPFSVTQLDVDAQNDNIVWEIGQNLRKSADGGSTWNAVTFPGTVAVLALDPRVSGTVYAISNFVICIECTQNPNQNPMFYRSTDGGATWLVQSAFPTRASSLTVDPSTNPSTIYGVYSGGTVYRSVDSGTTWTQTAVPPADNNIAFGPFTVDPSGTLYLVVSVTNQIFVSRDHAQSWTATGSFIPVWTSYLCCAPMIQSLVPAGSTGALYATTNQLATSGFVTKLSPDGSSIVFSTYLRGHASMEFFVDYAAEPAAMITQNSISGIALDPAGNVVVAGETRAVDFPVVAATQASSAGLADAFVAIISSDGSQLTESTYFGGAGDDGALAAGVDAQGEAIFAGQTWSPDFPVSSPNGPTGYGDSFVVKLAQPVPPTITSVVNGASFQPFIEAGSWVTIKGSNLANTFTGQTWTGNDIVNGNLPTSLNGVSVTIDGKPAFVEYVSPVQINVQAPSGSASGDAAAGSVQVVVNNNGTLSSPATVQLQTAAPAFFTYGGTSYAVATLYPDNAAVGNPAAVPGTIAAQPGDVLMLWGTGFGAANPPATPGVVVNENAALAATPAVTVGGVSATVLGSALLGGTVGLYQINIRLPSTVPSGPVALQASVNGQQTQASALLFMTGP